MERWLTVRTLVVVAIAATIGLPLLALLGVEIESGHVTAIVVVLAALAMLLVWLFVRRLFARFARWRRDR